MRGTAEILLCRTWQKIWKKLKKFGETVAAKSVALWNKLVLLFNKNKAQELDPNADVKGRITLADRISRKHR